MDPRLRHLSGLRYFEAAARLKSYSKAAQELHISQAAVSQQLRQLETVLACKLFLRKGRDMVLSPEGEKLYKRVSLGFEHIISGLNIIQSEPLEGTLSIATTPSFASRWFMPRLWKFSKQYPNIPIRLSSSFDPATELSNQVDIALGELSISTDQTDNVLETLFEEPIFPVCSPILAQSLNLRKPEQLLKCWLVRGFRNRHFSWSDWFNKANVTVSQNSLRWIEVETFDMGISAVIAGHGVCPGTDSLVGDLLERGLLVKPFDISITPGVQYAAMYSSKSIRVKRITVFIQWLKTEALSQTQ